MTNIYVLTIKDPDRPHEPKEIHYYTSIEAMYYVHGKETIKISKDWASKVLSSKRIYDNDFVTIVKLTALSKKDVMKKDKDQD